MARMPFSHVFWMLGLVCGLLLSAGWSVGCGDPDACNNDSDCTGGKICLRLKCAQAPADAGAEPRNEPPPDRAARPEPPRPEPPRPEPPKPDEAKPDERTTPDVPTKKPGTRTEGQVCDPRVHAYFYDRCGPGLGCAEYAQTTPQSGAPQPYGICMKACKDASDTSCPSGTICHETKDTKTRQGTGIWVCGREVKDGDLCVNTDACAKGLTCTKFGTTGTNWTCQKDCTNDASACASGQKCEPAQEGSGIKICKQVAKAGEICSDSVTCDSQSFCFEGNRFGAFAQRCRKRCNGAGDCAQDETCQQLSRNGAPVASICLKGATQGQECNNGASCATNHLCQDLATSYASCFKRCGSDNDCAAPLRCARISAQNGTRVCKEQLQPGDQVLNLGDCGFNSRAIQLGTGIVICLPNCSAGTGTNAALCGKLTPGVLKSAIPHGRRGFITAGDFGVAAFSKNGGTNWSRTKLPTKVSLSGVAASGDGKIVLLVGLRGTVIRSEDEASTWSLVTSGVPSNLSAVAVSHDGTTALIVGPKGTLLRSEDGGKTWKTITPPVTTDLNAVSFARDSGTGTSAPLAFAVGNGGKVLRSEDAGKTWNEVTGISANIRGLALLRDRTATGPFGVLVGDQGGIWTSTDEGKTWTKETSGVTATLRAAHHDDKATVVAGNGGTILQRDQAGKWTKLTTGSTLALYGLAYDGKNWTAVGERGTSLNSTDGTTWAETLTQAHQCVGISSGGRPSGGVCLFRCQTLAQGSDCPFGLGRCSGLNLGNSTVNVCFPSASAAGTASAGDACTTYAAAPPEKRCKENHVCGFLGTGFFCLRRCNATDLKCDAGETCNFVNTLQGSFCGKTVDKGQVCDLGKSLFCKAGSTCVTNRLNGKSVCDEVQTAKETETCDNQRRPCASPLICSGLGATPYRRFCTRRCNPTGSPTGCKTGWDCLQTSPGNGICVERCTSPNHVCETKHVRCQRVTSGNNSHCI